MTFDIQTKCCCMTLEKLVEAKEIGY